MGIRACSLSARRESPLQSRLCVRVCHTRAVVRAQSRFLWRRHIERMRITTRVRSSFDVSAHTCVFIRLCVCVCVYGRENPSESRVCVCALVVVTLRSSYCITGGITRCARRDCLAPNSLRRIARNTQIDVACVALCARLPRRSPNLYL